MCYVDAFLSTLYAIVMACQQSTDFYQKIPMFFGAMVITENNVRSSINPVFGKISLLLTSLAPTFHLVLLLLFWVLLDGGCCWVF